jgi:hypothetical protein
VATFDVDSQNDLALDGPDNATASLHADMTQRRARAFVLGGRRLRIGSAGLVWSLRASGRGVRSEPTIPRSTIFVSGGMALADARGALSAPEAARALQVSLASASAMSPVAAAMRPRARWAAACTTRVPIRPPAS